MKHKITVADRTFELKKTGLSNPDIVRQLNKEGYKTPSGTKLSQSFISAILRGHQFDDEPFVIPKIIQRLPPPKSITPEQLHTLVDVIESKFSEEIKIAMVNTIIFKTA